MKRLSILLIFVTSLFSTGCVNSNSTKDKQKEQTDRPYKKGDPSVWDSKNEPDEEANGNNAQGNQRFDEGRRPPHEPNNYIPPKVYKVLDYVKKNGQAMRGYSGGRKFQNRERLLNMTDARGNKIQYQEWDVNPKVRGRNRGMERLITGSDNRAWYTNDHYRSFIEIK